MAEPRLPACLSHGREDCPVCLAGAERAVNNPLLPVVERYAFAMIDAARRLEAVVRSTVSLTPREAGELAADLRAALVGDPGPEASLPLVSQEEARQWVAQNSWFEAEKEED